LADPDLPRTAGVGQAPGKAFRDPLDGPSITAARPFVRVEISSSIVAGDVNDKGRFYRFVAGVPLGGNETILFDGANAAITIDDKGMTRTIVGESGLSRVDASDSVDNGQTASLRFHPIGVTRLLAARIRPQDRIRIEVILPPIHGTAVDESKDPWFKEGRWLVFDGLARSLRANISAGSGYSAGLAIQAGGLHTLLAGATFNWQGFIHPDSSILKTKTDQLLSAGLGTSAQAPHVIIQAFVESVLSSSMGIKIGDSRWADGLDILQYCRFGEGAEWSTTVFAGKPIAYPSPWSLLQQQSGQSFWNIIQAVAEPFLHEVFVGYRLLSSGDRLQAALVHRPRPFPGIAKYDSRWLALPVRRIGRAPLIAPMDVSEDAYAGVHPNCFHWAGLGIGDHSKEVFNAKLFFGWATSDALVNRFGYVSQGVMSKLAPLAPGSEAVDMLTFGKESLLHFATQEAPRTLMRSRNYGGMFLPVRPGEVLEDRSLGDATEDIATGYVTSTSFCLSGSDNGFSLSMGATVDRVIIGTDAPGYPDAARALVPDLTLKQYAGADVGDAPAAPAVTATTPPLVRGKAVPPSIPEDLVPAIQKASGRQAIPSWVVAHVLQNETGFGANMGGPSTRRNGIAQITSIAALDLVQRGYRNPDGTVFKASDKTDREKCVHACAAILKNAMDELIGLGLTETAESYWSWVVRAYRWGVGSTHTLASATGWKWPTGGEAFPDYRRYWSPDGVSKGYTLWRGI
jgi:hypothetical protein